MEYNLDTQSYKGTKLKLIVRKDYKYKKAKRFVINDTNQNIWIPNYYLLEDGTIKKDANLDWAFNKYHTQHKIDISLKYNAVKKYKYDLLLQRLNEIGYIVDDNFEKSFIDITDDIVKYLISEIGSRKDFIKYAKSNESTNFLKKRRK